MTASLPRRILKGASHIILAPLLRWPGCFGAGWAMCACAPFLSRGLLGEPVAPYIIWFTLWTIGQALAVTWPTGWLALGLESLWKRGGATVWTIYLTLTALTALLETGIISTTRSPLNADAVGLLLETNSTEIHDFFSTYLSLKFLWGIALLILLIAAGCVGMKLIVRLMRGSRAFRGICAVGVCVGLIWGGIRLTGMLRPLSIGSLWELLEWECGWPEGTPILARDRQLSLADGLSKWVFIGRRLHFEERSLHKWEALQRDYLANGAAPARPRNNFNVVVIIGESFLRSHSSLYGYHLPVNPRLTAEADSGNLTAYRDVQVTANFTTLSLRDMLNLHVSSRGQRWEEGIFFPLVMKKAGWKVSLFDNQTVSRTTDRGLSAILYFQPFMQSLYEAVGERTYRYDCEFTTRTGDIVDSLRHTAPGKRLVIYHLMGQHFNARYRRPDTGPFTAVDIPPDKPWLDLERRQIVADYANATIYNDSVVGSIIDRWRDTPTVLLYFSDHGVDCWDEVPPEARNVRHPEDSAWVERHLKVPFLVWTSQGFQNRFPEKQEALRNSAQRPISLDTLGHFILTLCDVPAPR